MRSHAWFVSLVGIGCGPAVATPAAHDDGSVGSSSAASSAGAASDGGADETGSPAACGNGVLEASESCDDGNAVDADGCSHACEPSGTRTWSVELADDGAAVAVASIDGDAFVALQHLPGAQAAGVSLSRVASDGTVTATYLDEAGFADTSIARQPVAVTAEGDFVVGYPGTDGRGLARIDLAAGVVWSSSFADGSEGAGVVTVRDTVLHLRHDSISNTYELHRVGVDGAELGTMPVPVSAGSRPIGYHRMYANLELMIFTENDDGEIRLLGGIPNDDPSTWNDDLVLVSAGGRPRAAGDAERMWVWTESDRASIDMLGHLDIAAVPRTTTGSLAWFAGETAVLLDHETSESPTRPWELVATDADEHERWRAALDDTPQFVAGDGRGGIYVLLDRGNEAGSVRLERWVL